MTEMKTPTAVHLVGSVGLDSVEDVFRTIGKTLGPYLRVHPMARSVAGSFGSVGNIRCCARAFS